jgi:hypothetical protein
VTHFWVQLIPDPDIDLRACHKMMPDKENRKRARTRFVGWLARY